MELEPAARRVDDAVVHKVEHADLRGQVAIVTGASRGIGKGLALGLARAGAKVVCAARTVEDMPGGLPGSIRRTAADIEAAGGTALAVRCDIGTVADVQTVVEAAVSHFGRLDILVNNAMTPTRGRFDEITLAMWDESMTTNVRSLFTTTRAVAPHMAKSGGGSIINISSAAADHSSNQRLPAGFTVYAVAKAALERFSTILAAELADHGIAINALRPGAVRTELAERELGEDFDWSGWTTPEAVVPAVTWLADQRGGGFSGRIVDSTQFGSTWP
jgi:NAD(P)-dependent dehydrogenase (short-subunit alcohol dehydrogenase family)